MVQLKTLLLPALSLVGTAYASAVIDLVPTNFDDRVFSGTPALVEFFAPWCGHCKRLAPVYEELAGNFVHANKQIRIGKVDGDEHKSLSTKYGISGFPTIKYFDGKSKDPVDYTGGRDLESLQAFITEKTGVKPKKAPELPSDVEMLDDSTFSKAIGGDKGVFVAFTAPWCGHCKTLAPIWETVAHSYAPDSSTVTIAKVDAEANKAVAKDQGISGFPTIKYFPKGSTTPVDYSGGRDERSFMSFVNEQAGTQRVPGGGLNIEAGTIEALDEILDKYTGSNLDDISAQVKKASTGLKDAYAGYYLKVLDKIKENAGYVEKESGRIQGLLKKGGLARDKEDDLTSRLNVLKQFVPEKIKEEL